MAEAALRLGFFARFTRKRCGARMQRTIGLYLLTID